jgi:RHS repeat-associated protein
MRCPTNPPNSRAVSRRDAAHYYHTNSPGTVVALTWWDADAGQEKLVEDYQYDAYGFASVAFHGPSTINHGPLSRVGNPYTFTARALDPETDLVYFRARYYSTTQGRFISRDPLDYVGGLTGVAASPLLTLDAATPMNHNLVCEAVPRVLRHRNEGDPHGCSLNSTFLSAPWR